MGERESQRHRAAEAVADQHRVLADIEFVEAVLDRRHVGVHQRQRRRLRAVEAGQVDQGDAVLGGERRQHRIEGVAVGEQRMQHHQIAAFAGAHRRERAVAGGQVLHLHCVLSLGVGVTRVNRAPQRQVPCASRQPKTWMAGTSYSSAGPAMTSRGRQRQEF